MKDVQYHHVAEQLKRLNPWWRSEGFTGARRALAGRSGVRSVVHSPEMDITLLGERARNAVRHKTPIAALKALANLHYGVNAKKTREEAIATLRKYPLQAFFPATTMSRDGRVIAKRPGMGLAGEPTPDDEIVIRARMINDFQLLASLAVQGEIVPALQVILMEHRLSESDFVALASRSPVVPPGRAGLFGKAVPGIHHRARVGVLAGASPQRPIRGAHGSVPGRPELASRSAQQITVGA